MYRPILLVTAGAFLALAEIPVNLWPQVAIGPPGTNNTERMELVPGITPIVGGRVPGVPVPGQPQTTGGPAAGGGLPSIITGGPGGGTAGRGPGTTSDGTVSPAQPAGSACDIKLIETHATVGPNGGLVEIAITPLPEHCKPSLGASGTWLQLAGNGVAGNVYRFSAAPNTTPLTRTARVVIGDQVFLVEQSGLIRTRLAAAPAKVVIGLSPKYTEHKREIALWADKPGMTLAVAANAPWLRVQAKHSRKPETRTFDVIVDSSKLPEGERHEGTILVTAEGAPPLSVPVVVERISQR